MSILPDPFKEADRLIDEVEADAPATMKNIAIALLQVLSGHELVIRISLETKK